MTRPIVYALRALGRTPGFTAVAVATLAIGIGATTAIFSIVDAIFLHPLPFRDAGRLVVVWEKLARNPSGPPIFDSYRDFEVWKAKSTSFEEMAAATWAVGGQIVTGAGPARDALAMPVGMDFFPMLGIAAEIGRTFQADDLARGCSVVLSHRFWAQAFTADRQIAGRKVSLDGASCSITGVMPESFRFYPEAAAMWMLITPESPIARDPERSNVGVFGRLRPGVTTARAQEELEALRRADGHKDPPGSERVAFVSPLAQQFAYLSGPTLRLSVIVLFGAVLFVLMIACVNLAGLLLGRSLIRQKELAVRAALGCGRARLVRQLLVEALLLSVAGSAAGSGLAAAAVHGFRVWKPIELPPGNPVAVNPVVLAFAAALTFMTAIGAGLLPALRASRVDPIEALKAHGRSGTGGPGAGRFRRALATAQVALSISLLAGAGLLIASVHRLASVPLGFQTERTVMVSLQPPKWRYADADRRARVFQTVLERVEGLRGVEAAGLATSLPLNRGRYPSRTVMVEGRSAPGPDAPRDTAPVTVTAGYFRAMGDRLMAGRNFDERDRSGSEPVAIVNQSLARAYFGDANPIGLRIRFTDEKEWMRVVGVVSNEKNSNFFAEMRWEEIPMVFRPVAQQPPQSGTLVAHLSLNAGQIGAAIQKQIRETDGEIPVGDVLSMDEQLSRVLAYPRFRAVLLGGFAGLALLLAGVGLYGVMAQSTAQRVQEFGVRMALGAERRDVARLVAREGLLLTATGFAIGLAIAFAVTRLLASLVFEVNIANGWIWCGVSLILGLVALIATAVPAWRASRVDPIEALRYE